MALGRQFGSVPTLSDDDVDQPAIWQSRTGGSRKTHRGAYYEMTSGDDEGASGEQADDGGLPTETAE